MFILRIAIKKQLKTDISLNNEVNWLRFVSFLINNILEIKVFKVEIIDKTH